MYVNRAHMIQFTGIDIKQHQIEKNNLNRDNSNLRVQKSYSGEFTGSSNKKIGFVEGSSLFFNGVYKQAKDIVLSMVKHPVRTLALFVGTSAALMTLPLIGIPSAVGGGVLAIGFAGFSIAKAVVHAVDFSKNNKKGTYDIARYNLQQLGEDTLDIGLSVPFVPKAITGIKSFTKYGKVGINNSLISGMKNAKGYYEKLKVLSTADFELSRNFNFQSAVDKELSLFENITPAEKAKIRKELLDFNVAFDKIPEVVLDKYAQIRGIKTKPDLKVTTMAPNTHGIAVADNCRIYLNDYKPYFGKTAFADYVTIKQEIIGENFHVTYKNKLTGEILKEVVNVDIVTRYNDLCSMYNKLSPEAARILTILHEREHIHQFAQVSALKGLDFYKTLTQRGKQLFGQMIAEMPKINPNSTLAAEIESFTLPAANGTPIAYIRRPLEVAAREIEHKALKNHIFTALDSVFKQIKSTKNLSMSKNIVVNDVRIESSKC